MGGNETLLCARGGEGELEEVAGLGHPTPLRVAESGPGATLHSWASNPGSGPVARRRRPGMASATPGAPLPAPGDRTSSGTTEANAGGGASGGPTARMPGSPRRPQWVGSSLGSRGLIPAGPRARPRCPSCRPRGTQGSCGPSSRLGCCLGSTEAAASFLPPPTSCHRCFLFWRPLPSSLCTWSTPHTLTPPPPSQHFPSTPPDTAAPPRSLLFLGNTNARG